MSQIISASIDLSKIDKSKVFKNDGKEWYNIQISVNDEPDKFGNNVVIIQNQSKEEREAKKDRIYLGNGRVVWSSEKKNEHSNVVSNTNNDDLPF